MATHIGSRIKALFDKAFPERQIYHRSGGSVRYVSVSPWRQAGMAGLATIVVGWCLFATVSVLLRGPTLSIQNGASDRKVARYERELKQARAGEAIALSLLEKRTSEFEQHITEAQDRHTTLKFLLANLQGQDVANAVAMSGANFLVDSTIEEADPRQSHPGDVLLASNDVAGFRAKFDGLRAEQTAFLNTAEDEAVSRAESARGVIRLTGVPLSRLLEQPGMGGPLVEIGGLQIEGYDEEELDSFERRVLEVAARLQEAQAYEDLMNALPLGAPLSIPYRETSGFGFRSDPFTRRTAWHDGVDIAAYSGAPITATAPGTVIFAGTKAGYGRCVEIDHGLGFVTRYGHLQSVTARRGETIAIGEKVGTMGSTGRSTGPHLHYEVMFRGKTYDPIKFLRAGKHVHEG